MRKLRLFGIPLALILAGMALVSHARPAFAACPSHCTSTRQCQQCTGNPDAVCLGGGLCAF
ncbi:MAG TPA: hypothetical protein VF173_26800 [Thermoanaerobaculia bacterium]|nr:hypothetical protein [Thermoanaerobaculia bacterium]